MSRFGLRSNLPNLQCGIKLAIQCPDPYLGCRPENCPKTMDRYSPPSYICAAQRAKLRVYRGRCTAAADVNHQLFTSVWWSPGWSYMKQHTHTRTRSHRQRTHRGASGIGSSLACGGIKYDMRLAGTVRLPQSRGVLRRLQSRSAWHCLVPVQHRPTEYWSASPPPPPPLSLWRRACLRTSAAW